MIWITITLCESITHNDMHICTLTLSLFLLYNVGEKECRTMCVVLFSVYLSLSVLFFFALFFFKVLSDE